MKLIHWSASDVGRKREHNEDSFLVDERLRLYAVADGMGGHQGGDHASRLAVDVLHREVVGAGDFDDAAIRLLEADPSLLHVTDPHAERTLNGEEPVGEPAPEAQEAAEEEDAAEAEAPESMATGALATGRRSNGEAGSAPTDPAMQAAPPPAATVLRAAARVAGRAIFDAAQNDSRLAGMGTTLTALLIHRDKAHLVHVGDSRAFLYRDGKISQVTEDHSWIAEQVKAGILTESEAKESKFRHIITRSVGFEREVEVDLIGVPIVPGDCFVLCSDGCSNFIETEELGKVLQSTYYGKVPQLLVDIANDRGGDDNITVVLVYVANEKG
jgi:serine/threonine protein phosphatase PrpC